MEAKELTSQHRIEILEDVLQKLESGYTVGGLCAKINDSAFELFEILDKANKIIPTLTLENANKVTKVKDDAFDNAGEGTFWWNYYDFYDFESRIKFVKWMIEMEKSFLNK